MTEATAPDPRISALIETLRRQGITGERVLAAIASVPRQFFVDSDFQDDAWGNVALPIEAGQTISQPLIVAVMTDALQLNGRERVLEIGTGSGYQAAILSRLAQSVITIERHEELANSARALLAKISVTNVEVLLGDGTLGYAEMAPFDGILVTAAAPSVPTHLLEQLSPNHGRLVVPLGSLDEQRLTLVIRDDDRLDEHDLGPVKFVPLIGEDGWKLASLSPD